MPPPSAKAQRPSGKPDPATTVIRFDFRMPPFRFIPFTASAVASEHCSQRRRAVRARPARGLAAAGVFLCAGTAHAANGNPPSSSMLSLVLLVGLVVAVMLAFALWSWHHRRQLAKRQREAAAALRESEARLRQLSSQLPIALFQYRGGEGGGFRYVSEGIRRLLPHAAAEIEADPQRFFAAIHPGDLDALAWLRAEAPTASEFEWTGRCGGGESPRWVQIRATAEIGADGRALFSGAMIDVTQLKGAQQALEQSRAELRALAAHREARVEQERLRLAREFHDELGQTLTAARMQLQLLGSQLEGEPRQRARDVEVLIGEAYRSVKTIASDLRPAALNMGLTAAVEWLAGRLLTPAGIGCRVDFSTDADGLAEEQAIVLFRIVQESLNNIVRHAGAGQVGLEFDIDGGTASLRVRDDGRGFDPESVDRGAHFGLLGIAERAQALGGRLRVESRPGHGSCLRVDFTIAHPTPEEPA